MGLHLTLPGDRLFAQGFQSRVSVSNFCLGNLKDLKVLFGMRSIILTDASESGLHQPLLLFQF